MLYDGDQLYPGTEILSYPYAWKKLMAYLVLVVVIYLMHVHHLPHTRKGMVAFCLSNPIVRKLWVVCVES
jgi:hypothetical protein